MERTLKFERNSFAGVREQLKLLPKSAVFGIFFKMDPYGQKVLQLAAIMLKKVLKENRD